MSLGGSYFITRAFGDHDKIKCSPQEIDDDLWMILIVD